MLGVLPCPCDLEHILVAVLGIFVGVFHLFWFVLICAVVFGRGNFL